MHNTVTLSAGARDAEAAALFSAVGPPTTADEGRDVSAWYTLAHDLKNLLVGVETVLGLATREPGALKPRVQQLLLDARLNCEEMGEMLADVLDLYALRRNGSSVAADEINLILVIEKCVRMLRAMAEEKNILVRVALPDETPKVRLDERRFTRVLVNLLHNALKFSPPGKRVDVDVRVEDGDGLVVTVTDHGAGLSHDQAQRLFSADCHQPAPDRGDRETGHGIGLRYCRTAVPVMGGELWVESPPRGEETGSQFGFRLPLGKEGRP